MRRCWRPTRARTGSSPQGAALHRSERPRTHLRGGYTRHTPSRSPSPRACSTHCPTPGPGNCRRCREVGQPNTLGLPTDLVIGSVFRSTPPARTTIFLVLPNGTVAQVNSPTAAALRATQSVVGRAARGGAERGRQDLRAGLQVAAARHPIKVVSRQVDPAQCWTWERRAATIPHASVMIGRRLPISPSAELRDQADRRHGNGLHRRRKVHGAAVSGSAGWRGAQYYIDQQGVRYGMPDQDAAGAGASVPQNRAVGDRSSPGGRAGAVPECRAARARHAARRAQAPEKSRGPAVTPRSPG